MEAPLAINIITLALVTCGRHVSLLDEHWNTLLAVLPTVEPQNLVNFAAVVGRLQYPNEFMTGLREKAIVLMSEGRLDSYQQAQLALATGSPLPSDCTIASSLQLVAALAWDLTLPVGSLETARAASLRATPRQAQDALWGYVGLCEINSEVGDPDLGAVLHRRSEATEWSNPLVKFQTILGVRNLWGIDLGVPAEAPTHHAMFGVSEIPSVGRWQSSCKLACHHVDTYNDAKALAGDVLRNSSPEERAFARVKCAQISRMEGVSLKQFRTPDELLEWRETA